MSYYSQQFASGAQHTSWQQQSQAQQQFTGHMASSMHPSSSSFRSAETDMPWRDCSYQPYNPPHSSSQQWTAPAAAEGGSASFNYGFGQALFDQQPSMSSYSHASQPTQSMGRVSSYHSTQPAQQQQQAGPGPGPPQFPPDYPNTDTDDLKLVKNLPAAFQPIFSFRYFNPVQSECFDVASASDVNMVVSAPTGAGKTGVMELAILRLLSKHLTPQAGPAQPMGAPRQQQHFQAMHGSHKTIYLGPIKALVQERQQDWQARFGTALGLKVLQLTGDDNADPLEDLEAADIICSTPEKFDQVTRKVAEKGSMGFFGEIGLVLLDEVHLLNESGRGSSLEAGCVCRIKAVAALPEMTGSHLASVRFVAVSATIPNISDIARWLSVPPTGLRQYGDELRPCKLTTHVKGYAPSKNDFVFERRLNEYVFTIVKEYSKGRPALVFCSSRKGTIEAASAIIKEAEACAQVAAYSAPAPASTGSVFVRDMSQLQRLRTAAANTQGKALASVLVAGVGFHNAAMEPTDRTLVEELFKANDLAVLCTTSTLAMGVNLPAHLVVLKGTVRWVGDSECGPGEQSGYKQYSQTEVLQMVGRAGRPQFDQEGVAVIMTSRDSTHRYQRLLAGQVVESCLMATLPEHLNAEIVLGTVKDISQAIAWIRSTFLFTRVRANPQHYGVKLTPGASEAELDAMLRDQVVLKPVKELMKYQLVESDEDNYSLTATPAGKLMAANFLKLKTMAAIIELGERPNVPSLLRVICAAEEFKNTGLRRSEKKVLNEVNHSKELEQLRYHVMASKDGNKIKERVSLPAEKLFLLLNDALADKPCEALDYSLKQEQTRIMVVGQRIAKCMAKYYALRGSFSSAGRSLLLTRSLKNRLWEDSNCSVRQLPSVGRQLGARLAAGGLGSLQAVAACGDPHKLEVAAQKSYPWGSELLATLKAHTPPAVDINMQLLGPLRNGQGYSCQITVARQGPAAGAAQQQLGALGRWAANSAGGAGDGLPSTVTPCQLLVGCTGTDELVLYRHVVLEKMESPTQVTFKVSVPAGVSQALNVTAMLLHEKIIGFDQRASITLPPLGHQPGRHGPAANTSSRQQLPGSSGAAVAEEPSSQDGVADAGAWGEDSAAAAAAAARPKASRRATAAAGEEEGEDGEGGGSAQEGMGAAAEGYAVLHNKQQLRAKRAREAAAARSDVHADDASAIGRGAQVLLGAADTPAAAAHGLGSMLPPAKRPRGSRHAALGAATLSEQDEQQRQEYLSSPHRQLEQPPHYDLTGSASFPDSMDVGPSATAGPFSDQNIAAPMQSSIAARYRSIFSSAAGGQPSSSQQVSSLSRSVSAVSAATACRLGGLDVDKGLAGTASVGAGAGASRASGIPSGSATVAMDSGELQVTPAGSHKTPRPALPSTSGDAADSTLAAQQPTAVLQHTQPPGSQPSAAAGCSFGSQQDQLRQQEDAGAAGQVCYDMFSMFDLLADDDDVEQQQDHQQHNFSGSEQLHGMPLQHQPQHSQLLRPAAAPAAKQQPRLFSPSMADQALSSQQQQWRQRQPLAELLPVEHGDALAEAPALPTGKASARAHFGAAVQRSHKATSSLLSSLQRPSRPASQPPPSLKVLPPQTALADAAAASVGSVYGPASGDLLPLRSQPSHSMPLPQPSQQLLTPPHQIKPMFAEPAAGARWGATGSSNGSAAAGRLGQQGGQQPVADWAADNPGPGGQPHGGRELPDLGRFAFNAGPTASAAALQPAAFKPSANAAMFGHLPGAQPRSIAQGKLLSRAGPTASDAGRAAGLNPSYYSQRQSAGLAPGSSSYRAQALQQGRLGSAMPKVSLPGGAPWQQFVSERQPAPAAAGAASEEAVVAAGQLPECGGNLLGQDVQQRSSKQQARAAWQGSVPSFGARAGRAAAVFGGTSSAVGVGGAAWRSSLSAEDVFGADDVFGAPLQPVPSIPTLSAVQPVMPQHAPGPAEAAAGGGLDMGDIFAFMR